MNVAPSAAMRAALASLNQRPVTQVEGVVSSRQRAEAERHANAEASAPAKRSPQADDRAKAADAGTARDFDLGAMPKTRPDGRPARPGSLVDLLV
jgi:hypothetical protein